MASNNRRRRSGVGIVVMILCVTAVSALAVYGVLRWYVRPPELPVVDNDEDTNQTDPDDTDQQDQEDPAPANGRKESFFNILLSGLDDHNGGSDTNILLSVDGKNNRISAVSIPRDTLLNVSWNVKKFNTSYNVGGTERMMKELSNLLGIPVDFYITVDLEGFVGLIDEIGGVDFDVPVNMNYDDPKQGLHIHLDKGYQHLTGEEAMGVVRWRQNNDGSGYATGDIGRIETQQAFLTAVAGQVMGSLSVSTLKAAADMFVNYVDTELSVGNLVWIGEVALKVGVENVHFYTLPGEGKYIYGGSYYVLNPAATLDMVNNYFNPYTEDITLEDMDILVP